MKSVAIYVLIYDIIATAGNLFGSLIKKLVIKKSRFDRPCKFEFYNVFLYFNSNEKTAI